MKQSKTSQNMKVINIIYETELFGLCFVLSLAHPNHLPMLIKSPSVFQAFARQKEEVTPRELTRKQWIMADRIVIIALFMMVIIGSLVFA
jgi:hypothetical protein